MTNNTIDADGQIWLEKQAIVFKRILKVAELNYLINHRIDMHASTDRGKYNVIS